MLVQVGTDISQTGIGNDRPDLIAPNSAYLSGSNPIYYLNRAAFQNPAPGTFGTLGRDALFGPGQVSFNLALSRTFHLKERWRLEGRFEAFNVINHANFNLPNVTFSNSQFGVISSTPTVGGDPRILQFAMKLHF